MPCPPASRDASPETGPSARNGRTSTFKDHDHATALRISSGITPEYVSDILQSYVDSDLIGPDQRLMVLAQITPLLNLIASEKIPDDKFWTLFQRHFGFHGALPKIVPMNAANLCPEPNALINAANLLRNAYNQNVAQQVRTTHGERVRQMDGVRRRLATAFKLSDPNDLALIRNSSEGNNAINCGYRKWTSTNDPAALDTVIVWDENHPTNLEAWRLRRDLHTGRRATDDRPKAGDPFRLIVVELHRNDNASQIAEAFIRHIDNRTRFVTFSSVSNGNGMRIPDEAIEKIWRHVESGDYPNCHIHIDGTMSWGAMNVNLGDAKCHSFVSSAHKWFLGPKETAAFYMDKRKVGNFAPSIFAYDYQIRIGHWDKMPGNALRFEMLGQRDDVNLITLDTTQMMWDALQRRRPYARVVHLATRLKRALTHHGWAIKTPMDESRSSGIVRIEAPKKDRQESPSLYDWMYNEAREHRFGGSGGSEDPELQTFRLCPHIYNTEADIDNAVASMNLWRREHGRIP